MIWKAIRQPARMAALFLLTLYATPELPADDIRLASSNDYILELLQLALDHADSGHKAVVVDQTANRLRNEQRFRKVDSPIDVIAYTYTAAKNEEFRMIRFPIYLGLHGKRVLLTRKSDPGDLSISSLEDVKKLTNLTGTGWLITDIMKQGGYRIQVAPGAQLLQMFGRGRGDVYSRSLDEVWRDMDKSIAEGFGELVIYPRLVMDFGFETFFYVRKPDEDLAITIEEGLKKAWESGDVQKLAFEKLSLDRLAEFLKAGKPTVLKINSPVVRHNMRENISGYEFTYDEILELADPEQGQ